MLTLIRENDDKYIIMTNSKFSSPLNMEGLVQVMHAVGVRPQETECAIIELVKNNHATALFGINKTFLYTTAADIRNIK